MGCFRLKRAYVLAWVGKKRGERDNNVTFLKPFIEIHLLSECFLEYPLGILGKCILWVEGRCVQPCFTCTMNRESLS